MENNTTQSNVTSKLVEAPHLGLHPGAILDTATHMKVGEFVETTDAGIANHINQLWDKMEKDFTDIAHGFEKTASGVFRFFKLKKEQAAEAVGNDVKVAESQVTTVAGNVEQAAEAVGNDVKVAESQVTAVAGNVEQAAEAVGNDIKVAEGQQQKG